MKPWVMVAAAAVGLGVLVYVLSRKPGEAPYFSWPVLPSGPPPGEPASGPFCR